jgi:GTP-binding protein HflX
MKPSQRNALERLASRKIPADKVITQEPARRMTELSFEIGRQIGLIIDRKGRVVKALVGDPRSIMIPKLDGRRVGPGRLRGLRIVHTHLKDEPLSSEDLADLALLRLDMMASIGVDGAGLPTTVQMAHLLPPNPGEQVWRILDPTPPSQLDLNFSAFIKSIEDEISRTVGARSVKGNKPRAYLVAKTMGQDWQIEESLDELKELARSCGINVVAWAIQNRGSVHPRFMVGKGKLQEIVIDALQKGADLMVFDSELSPNQVKSIGDFTEMKVIDRSMLILDIFAQRATTRDGKLQVELAQLKYALPRLGEKDDALSRLTGGIGGRGPGETKLEIDRRRAHSRINFLEKQIEKLRSQRSLRRDLRSRRDVPVISIVGYTNAGKSTLLNSLTKSRIVAENKLFATLDPTTRRLRFPRETEVIITDTVGFIRELPETLMAAFRATLDELAQADLLVHVIDCANPAFEEQMRAVEKILDDLELSNIPLINVFNKIDLVEAEYVESICRGYGGIGLSATDSKSFPPLIQAMEEEILKSLNSPNYLNM